MNDIHEILPDPARPGSALQVPYALGRVAPYPDGRRVVMGEAAEPAVLGFVGRTGLTGTGHPIIKPQAASGAPSFFHDALQHADHLSGSVLVIDLGGSPVISVDRVSFIVDDPADAGRYAVFAVVLQCAEAGCHFYRFHAVGKSAQTCRQSIVGIHDHGIVHGLELAEPVLGRHVLIDLPCDRIQRPLDSFLELDLAHMGSVVVLRPVLDLFILHIGAGIISFFEGRRVDYQRLNGTAGLPVALESAVQRESRVDALLGPSADHGHDLSGAVVDTDRSALHLVLAVIRGILKVRQFLIHAVLQFLLHIQVKCGVDFVAPFEQLSQAGVVQLIVNLVVSGALLVACEVEAEVEIRILDLHQHFRRALISISEDIGVLIEIVALSGREVQNDLLCHSLIVLSLRDHLVLQHISEDQVPSLDGVIGMRERIVIRRAVGNRAQKRGL